MRDRGRIHADRHRRRRIASHSHRQQRRDRRRGRCDSRRSRRYAVLRKSRTRRAQEQHGPGQMSNDPKDPASIARMAADVELQAHARALFLGSCRYNYSYNFTWLGRPIIQYPQDLMALQEIIWQAKPELIVETGIAHGGSLIFSASMLELLGGNGQVLGIDVDIRPHNRVEIEKHPLARRISMIAGSSTDEAVVAKAKARASGKKSVLVILDSNHTHEH